MHKTIATLVPLIGILGLPALGYDSMYPRTAVGDVEVKAIPTVTVLETGMAEPYYGGENRLFMKLFDYIQKNDLSMTVPVEADMAPGRMRFFRGPKQQAQDAPSTETVEVYERDGYQVVSAGLRGAYNQDTYARGLERVRAWLREHPEWVPAGAPYAVYWHGPWMPGLLKRSEVHQAVEPARTAAR